MEFQKTGGIIGITMGCPVGIGPEIIIRLFNEGGSFQKYPGVVLGDGTVLERCARELAMPVKIVAWEPGGEIEPAALNVMNITALGNTVQWGRPDELTGRAMAAYIETAVRLLLNDELASMVTCPISKAMLQAAGYQYPGHTEMLAGLSSAPEFGMMMAGSKLRVTLVTIHARVADVPDLVTREAVSRMIYLTARSLQQDFGIKKPRLAVAGLNPHAGETGIFGNEEAEKITPAIAAARQNGLEVSGPHPPDTVFYKAAAGDFDAVVCMYHDQGLIPFKLLHFEDGVNFTMGLPIVRTSVDHGTAYDIAGKGLASPASLKAAVEMAGRIAINRHNSGK